jgi:RecB family exonuclease
MSESEVVTQFEKEMYRQRHGFNEKQFKLRMQQGKDLIPLYYQARSSEFRTYQLVLTEKSISAVIENVPITGFLDKIVFDGNRATVIDYKTGKPVNSPQCQDDRQCTQSVLVSVGCISVDDQQPSWQELGLQHGHH